MGMRGVECGGTSVQCNVKTGEKRLDILLRTLSYCIGAANVYCGYLRIRNTFGILKSN